MARSPSHKFGQIIGDLLQDALHKPLARIAQRHRLYFDYKKPRSARSGKKKVAWKDSKGNTHDLDYVFEHGGTEEEIGKPKAFIEIAWRRYTKHSRNKAQEIHGAIIPLAEAYRDCRPFLGVVLAGDFTDEAQAQLKSNNFQVLHFPYDTITAAFDTVGIDAQWNEETSDAALQTKVNAYDALTEPDKQKVAAALRRRNRKKLADFLKSLEISLSRRIQAIRILPLHGGWHESPSIADAINFIQAFNEAETVANFVRYEVMVRYTNSDEIRGEFHNKAEAVNFLHKLTD
jgi:hypothetical protein